MRRLAVLVAAAVAAVLVPGAASAQEPSASSSAVVAPSVARPHLAAARTSSGRLSRPAATSARLPRPSVPAGPWFAVLQPADARLGLLAPAGVRRATLSLSWDRAQPTAGGPLDTRYLAEVRARHRAMRAAGLDVVLSPGLQYVPDWVFALSPSSRFVDQHGNAWTGPTGDDVADAVFDPAVRAAQGAYLAAVGGALSDLPFAAVRVGGLVRGELHYPMPRAPGRADSFWAFSPAALAASPVPSWRPGTGDPAAAGRFLDFYLGALSGYGEWLLRRAAASFPRAELQVLMPSWGVRPGEVAAGAAGGLDGRSRGERRGTLQEGLDWARQAKAFAAVPRTQLYSTWIDAPDQGTDAVYESPVRHLVRLAAPLRLRVSGENTGRGDLAAMTRSVQRVRELRLTGLAWMREPDMHGSTYATLADFRRLITGREENYRQTSMAALRS